MTPVTLFSYITPEEQERMRICFDMHEAVYRNNETVMEYASSIWTPDVLCHSPDQGYS